MANKQRFQKNSTDSQKTEHLSWHSQHPPVSIFAPSSSSTEVALFFRPARRQNSNLERDIIFEADFVLSKKQRHRQTGEREEEGPECRLTCRLCSEAELRVIRGIATADLPPPSDPSCISRSDRCPACSRRKGPFSSPLSGGGGQFPNFPQGEARRQR